MSEANERMMRALNRLTKWRTVLAGWHLGSTVKEAPGTAAMRDLRELTMILRAEQSAMATLLERKGIFTWDEWFDAVGHEAAMLDRDMTTMFPGFRSTDIGMSLDTELAQKTMQEKGFPP